MKALLIEDEPAIAEALAEGLVAEDFVTETAGNGVDGLWMGGEFDYDVIILDIMLPELSGYEVCRRLRSAGVNTPILMLTAKSGELDQMQGLDLGADDYLTKPFSFPVLLARIRALLRRAPADRSPVLTVGDLSLDPAGHRCLKGGIEVILTAREFALAEFLFRRKGQIVTKSQIADHVWDAELDPDSNVVEVYIGYLRKKLDGPSGTPLIQTIRGAGYRLDDTSPSPSHGTRQ